MFLIYIDESGSFQKSDHTENFVLAGFIVNERNWRHLDDSIKKIKENYFPSAKNIEIHTVDIIHGKEQFIGISMDLRIKFLEEITKIIGSANIKVFAVVIKKSKMNNSSLVLDYGYEFLYERIAWNIGYLNKERIDSGSEEESAMIFLDGMGGGTFENVRTKMSKFILKGSKYDHNRMIIEDPIFTNSKWRGNIQLADILAYVFNHENKNKKINNTQMKKAIENIYKAANSKMIKPSSDFPAYCYKIWP